MSNYFDKLKNPAWQKKRLEILKRDNWTCQMCESKEKTLCIHHTYYNHKIDPWDYPNHCLITLCWPCHEREREAEVDAFENLKIILKESGFISTDIWSLFEDLGCILTFKNKKYLSKSIRKIVYQIHKNHK